MCPIKKSFTRNLSTQILARLTSVNVKQDDKGVSKNPLQNKAIMDSSNIEEEEETINVTGRLAFNKSESIESHNELNNKPVTLSEHFNFDKSKSNSIPIFETGKTWFSKLSSPVSYSATQGRRKSSLKHDDGDNTIAASYSKPLGHWPDLLVMDKNEPPSTFHSNKRNGKK